MATWCFRWLAEGGGRGVGGSNRTVVGSAGVVDSAGVVGSAGARARGLPPADSARPAVCTDL